MDETTSEDPRSQNPLHGMTLKAILEDLVARHGWSGLASQVSLRCFSSEPSINSSLKFLRKTAWARNKVERLYREDQRRIARNAKRNRRRAAMRAQRADQEAPAERETDLRIDEPGAGPATVP